MKPPPCLGCQRRYPGCGCREWQDWREEIHARKAELRKEKIADGLLLQNRIRRKRQY